MHGWEDRPWKAIGNLGQAEQIPLLEQGLFLTDAPSRVIQRETGD